MKHAQKSRRNMDQYEDLQDVDISILPEDEQPHPALEASNALPHFQFLDGRGAVQNSTERPIEGFVALKMTYEHVFQKQKEQNRQLQQRYRQLVSEVRHLRHSADKSEGSPDSSTESSQAASSTNDSLQEKTLESNKNKLRSGMIRLAACLLKKEPSNSPLSEVLRKIIHNLQSSQSNSEESLKELCSLFGEFGEWDDLIQWGNTTRPDDEKHASSTPTSKHTRMAYNVATPSDASLQNLINNYQQEDAQNDQGVIPKAQTKPKGQVVKPKMEKGLSYDEDMYGPATSTGDDDLVPYNIVRLHKKTMRLLEFPASFGSMMQSLASSRSLGSAIGEIRLDTSPQRGTPEEMSSFYVPSIKMPPFEFPADATSKDNDGTGPTTSSQDQARRNMTQVRSTGSTSPRRYTTQDPSRTSISGITDLGQLNSEKSQISEDFSYEQARGPPSVLSQTLTYDPNKIGAGATYNANPVTYVPQMHPNQNQVQNTTRYPFSVKQGSYTSGSLGRKKPESVIHRASASAPAKLEQPGGKTSNNELAEWALVTESQHQPYMPGSGSDSDQLVTAHSTDINTTEIIKRMQCPVCNQFFPPDTLEQAVSKHVGLHFDEMPKNDSFEILSS